MEFVSGYRDEFLDFTALLFGWFRKFVAERGAVETSLEGRWRQLEAQIRRLPQDPALWVLHVLPNRSVGISLGQGAEPGPGLGAGWLLGDQPPLHLQDLSPYVSFVSLEEGEEGEEEEEEEEEENREEEGAGTEKVEPEEDGEPVHTSRESPQEANLPGQPEEAEQKEGSGENGCQDERAEDETGPKRRKGRRSGKKPGLALPYPLRRHTPPPAALLPFRTQLGVTNKRVASGQSGLRRCFYHPTLFFNLSQHLILFKKKKTPGSVELHLLKKK